MEELLEKLLEQKMAESRGKIKDANTPVYAAADAVATEAGVKILYMVTEGFGAFTQRLVVDENNLPEAKENMRLYVHGVRRLALQGLKQNDMYCDAGRMIAEATKKSGSNILYILLQDRDGEIVSWINPPADARNPRVLRAGIESLIEEFVND